MTNLAKVFTGFLLIASLSACAPAGFVESTANVIDEMTAFRIARKQNTREAWEDFIRRYPNSSKAEKAKQWVAMMPERATGSNTVQYEIRKAEQEREERLRTERTKEVEAERLAEETKRKDDARIQEEEAKKQELEKQAQASTGNSQLLEELKKREEDLARREEALKKREQEILQAQGAAKQEITDSIDAPPGAGVPPSDENFAIVIGIEKYRDISANADFAEKDARTALLYFKNLLGVPEQNMIFLSGDRATRSDIAKWVESWLPLQVTPESKVYIYYSGHGAPDTKSQEAYILPYDGDPKALEITAYPLKRLYDKLKELPAKEIVVALDSCFSGAGGRSVIAQGARPLMTKLELGQISPKSNLTVFAAASGEEITGSYQAQQHGLFTYFFLKGMRGDADTDKNGWVSMQEEYDYIKRNVSALAKRDFREQTPQIIPDIQSLGLKAGQNLSKSEK